VSIFPSHQVEYAANGSTVVFDNGTAIEGRHATTGAFKYRLSVTNFSYISDELILFQNDTFLYAHEVETGEHRFGKPFFDTIEKAIVLGHYFVIWANNTLWGGTTDIGAMRWMITTVVVDGLTYCGPARVCVQSPKGLMMVDARTGMLIWGPNPALEFTTSRAFLSLSPTEGRLVVASGPFLNRNKVMLVNINTGDVLWNFTLGNGKSVIDVLINDQLVALTYLNVDKGSNNAYPSTGLGVNLTNGHPIFRYGPRGATMGASRFLSNGDIAYIGDEAIIAVSGKTGATSCELVDNVQDYSQAGAPAVLGTRFYATFFPMDSGYSRQQLVGLEC
jgi:outer membrane protein assembly factor BamB